MSVGSAPSAGVVKNGRMIGAIIQNQAGKVRDSSVSATPGWHATAVTPIPAAARRRESSNVNIRRARP
jgi:hypothetical protein